MSPNDTPTLRLTPEQATAELRALISPADPASLRCFAVLDGHAAGCIFTDHPDTPSWVVVQEGAFGSLYLAGAIQSSFLHPLITDLRTEGDVLIGLLPDDPRWSLLPPTPDYSGYTLEFTDRDVSQKLPILPTDCELRRLDESLFKQILDRNLLVRMYGSPQQALQWGYGLCLVHDDEILSEAFAGPAANGMIEIGVQTNPHHMQKGYGTLTCAHLIHQMEQLGYLTYWNCAKDNLPSTALARRLGYRTENEYRVQAWFNQNNSYLTG